MSGCILPTMSANVRLTVAEVVETAPELVWAFPDQPTRMARIEGEIDGRRYAAMVPPSMIGDVPMCEAYLRWIAGGG